MTHVNQTAKDSATPAANSTEATVVASHWIEEREDPTEVEAMESRRTQYLALGNGGFMTRPCRMSDYS